MSFLFHKFFQSSKLSTELSDVATATLPSPLEPSTAICTTPNQARRIIKTADGQQLVLCADDVKYLEVIDTMFIDLKTLNGEVNEEPSILIPISIDSATMYKIIDWSRSAKKTEESKLNFSQFFPDITIKQCIQILEASLFLGLTHLEKCSAKWIASKLEGKTTGEMAQILGVPRIGLCQESRDKLNRFNLATPYRFD
ncbi:unnamed protein product [Caenorhabditis nigoni]